MAGLFENFPYTNFQRLNLDWILQVVKSMEPVPAELDELRHYIEEHFPEEVQAAFDQAVQDGTLAQILAEELIFVTPQMYGAKGDGVTDDTDAIQQAIDSGNPVIFPKASYLVHAINAYDSAIAVKTGSFIIFQDATIVLAATATPTYEILNISDATDVTIIGNATIRGDRDIHMGSTGEHGMGLNIWQSERVYVEGFYIEKCWGDGVYINKSRDVVVRNVQATNNRRNNVSIIAGENILLDKCETWNANGTNPQAGIGVEANNTTDPLVNCVIRDCTSHDNVGASLYITCRANDSSVKVDGGVFDSRPGSTFITGSGVIEYEGCKINCGTAEIFSVDNVPEGSFVKFTDCELYGGSSIIRHAGGSGSVLKGFIVKNCISYNANLSRLGTWLTYGNGSVVNNIIDMTMINPTVSSYTSRIFLDPGNTTNIHTPNGFTITGTNIPAALSDEIRLDPSSADQNMIRATDVYGFPENCDVIIQNISGTYRAVVVSTGGNFHYSDGTNSNYFNINAGDARRVRRIGTTLYAGPVC